MRYAIAGQLCRARTARADEAVAGARPETHAACEDIERAGTAIAEALVVYRTTTSSYDTWQSGYDGFLARTHELDRRLRALAVSAKLPTAPRRLEWEASSPNESHARRRSARDGSLLVEAAVVKLGPQGTGDGGMSRARMDAGDGRRLGVAPRLARRLATFYWTRVYPLQGSLHRSSACRYGGAYDLRTGELPLAMRIAHSKVGALASYDRGARDVAQPG